MKSAVVLFAVFAVSAAISPFGNQRFNSPPRAAAVSVTKRPYAPAPQVSAPRVSVGDARSASVVKYSNEVNPDGSYTFFYETDNGIAAQAQGTPRDFGGNPPVVPVVSQGSFSWVSPEGQPIGINYVADENGYQPSGDALPTPPPVPPQIARALEWIARNARN